MASVRPSKATKGTNTELVEAGASGEPTVDASCRSRRSCDGAKPAACAMPRGRPWLACSKPRDALRAQRGQDTWVLSAFNGTASHRRRFYVDLAAQEPACNSNTFALDRRGWDGLCIEASPEYAHWLRQARTCTTVEAAIDSGVRNASFLQAGGYGGLIGDGLDNFRRHPRGSGDAPPALNLTTRRFVDVLNQARAPSAVDYLSLDLEGAEQRALTAEVLRRYTFLLITVERPTPRLNALLFDFGYWFVKNVDYDTHFVHPTHPRARELARNASFEQLPAKCTPHTPRRIKWLYGKGAGMCNGAGYYTIYSDLPRYSGSCCYHGGAQCSSGARSGTAASRSDCTALRYGPPTSAHALRENRHRLAVS